MGRVVLGIRGGLLLVALMLGLGACGSSGGQALELSVAFGGAGSGRVTSAPAGLDCASSCTATFAAGSTLTLTAAAQAGSRFVGWSGACTGTGDCVVSLAASRAVQAIFEISSGALELSVLHNGDGSGRVVSTPAGLDCALRPGDVCREGLASGTALTLTASAEVGSSFAGWGGACTGTGDCRVKMSEARSVTATFVETQPTVRVEKLGGGAGTVRSVSPAGLDCGATCAAAFSRNATVTLEAVAAPGSVFAGWGAPCSGTGPCSVSLAASVVVTATFSRQPPTVTRFTATPDALAMPGSVTLEWEVQGEGALSLSIDNGVGDVSARGKTGSVRVEVSRSTTFTLSAANAHGETRARATVAVGSVPVVTLLEADDLTVTAGQPVALEWVVTGDAPLALRLFENGVARSVSGSGVTVRPTATTTYRLEVSNVHGQDARQLTVSVGNAPVIERFEASRDSVTPGSEVTLSWAVTGAKRLSLSPDALSLSGSSVVVRPQATTRYTLTAENDFGTASRTLEVRVGSAPVIVNFQPDDATVTAGTRVLLSWSVTGASTLELSGVGEVTGSSASVTVNRSSTFTLTASNAFGSASASAEVTLGSVPSVSLSLSPTLIDAGRSATLAWSVQSEGTVTAFLNNGIGAVAATGSRTVSPSVSTEYVLTAENAFGVGRSSATLTVKSAKPADALSVLIAGQSNAAGQGEIEANCANCESPTARVQMLGNDYRWKMATEPVDSSAGQLDGVSSDLKAGHSFGLSFGKALLSVVDQDVFLIPSALGGSCLTSPCGTNDWTPGSVTRSTLFGSAVFRAQVSAGTRNNPSGEPSGVGGPVDAILWYQGESDAYNDARKTGFIANTRKLMEEFRRNLGEVPVFYAQLGVRRLDPTRNLEYQEIRERQRKMESGYGEGSSRLGKFYLVVTHDLPMVDQNHLNAEGQKELGRRLALAYQEHVLKLAVDGTGPRLVSISQESDTAIKVKTTQTLNASSNKYDAYFTVYVNKVALNAADVTVERHPSDPSAVRLSIPSGTTGTVSVSYGPPTNRALAAWAENVVRGPSGLPLPAFGDGTVGVDGEVGLGVPYSAGTR